MLCLGGVPLSLPADPSLTSSNVLAALETVSVDIMEGVLQTPIPKESQLRTKCADLRLALVNTYLQTHPCASWAHMAGRCLWWEEKLAFCELIKRVKHDKGMEVGENSFMAGFHIMLGVTLTLLIGSLGQWWHLKAIVIKEK